MSLRVLVTGAGGQLGRSLLKHQPPWIVAFYLDSEMLDITNRDSIAAALHTYGPHLVINAAAYTMVDKAESDGQRAYLVNEVGPWNLGMLAESKGIPVFHVSTDYVFSGTACSSYEEDDETDPINVYGASKLAGESALRMACSQHVILRTSWVFSEFGKNFVKTMLNLAATRSEVGVVGDQVGSPTSAKSIAEVLWKLAEIFEARGHLKWGMFHYSGSPACSWHTFAVEIFKQANELGMLDQTPIVRSILSKDYPTPAQRPPHAILSNDKLREAYQIKSSDWRTELTLVLLSLREAPRA